jgi:hypothetical protein
LRKPGLKLPDKPSIAVLPFANLSADQKQEYLANPRSGTPRSGYRGSDLVHWHTTVDFRGAAI